jgi:hypothetical protein
VDERPGLMASTSSGCHMASSYIHAPQVTRNVVKDDHDLYHSVAIAIFRIVTLIQICHMFTLPSKPQGNSVWISSTKEALYISYPKHEAYFLRIV